MTPRLVGRQLESPREKPGNGSGVSSGRVPDLAPSVLIA